MPTPSLTIGVADSRYSARSQVNKRAGSICGMQRQVATRCNQYDVKVTMGGLSAAATIGNWRTTHDILNACHDIRIWWGNWYYTGAGGSEIPVPSAFTLTAGFEATPGSSAPTKVTFNQGATSYAFAADHISLVGSDPIPKWYTAADLPAKVSVRTCATVALSTDSIPVYPHTSVSDGTCTDAKAFGSDVSMSGSPGFSTTNGSQFYGPCAITATLDGPNPIPVVIFLGDSIGAGFLAPTYGNVGFLVRAAMLEQSPSNTTPVLASRPWANVSHTGSGLSDYATFGNAQYRSLLLQMGDAAICQLSVNDLTTQTLAVMKTNALALWAQLASRGLKVYQLGTSLRTYSTRGWTDLAHQYPCGGLITGAANNGSGLIRISYTNKESIQPANGDTVVISNVNGTTEANGTWVISGATASVFDLVGSAFSNVYASSPDAAFSDSTFAAKLNAFVAWLYGTTSTDAMSQAAGNLTGVHDWMQALEVNVSGVATRGGGYWKVPATAVVSTTALTAGSSTTVCAVSATLTTNANRGWCIAVTHAGVTAYRYVTSNTTSAVTADSSFGFTPADNDVVTLTDTCTPDGVHLNDTGAGLAAAQEAINLATIPTGWVQ